ncbi:MAG: M13 family metallopeptidase [Pseudobdellovibrio sp.]
MSKLPPSSVIPEIRSFDLDDKINPCDDFHAYVCTKVEQSFKLRDDRSSHTFAFDDSDERLLEKKKDFFKNIDEVKNLSPRAMQFKNYYKACMNEKSSADEERKLVADLVEEMKNVKTIDQFIDLNAQNMTNEKWSVMSYDIMPNIDNPLVYDVTFDVSLMGLPEHSYYDNKELVAAYTQLMADFLNTIYPDERKEDHLKRAQAIVDFEIRFKPTYPLPAQFRDRSTEPRRISREDLFKNISKMKLQNFFDKNVPSKTLIRDFIPESIAFLQKELVPENLQVLKDMYTYRSARGFMDDAYPELFQKRWDFRHKFLGGPLTRSERQERCTSGTMDAFTRELDFEMLPKLFPHFPKDKMVKVAAKIRQSIIDGLQHNTWLSAKGKAGAIKKIKTAKLQLVQPTTDKEWDFKPVQDMLVDKPYENGKLLALASHERAFKRLREGVNQEAWGMGPLTVNAYYSPDKNKFVLPIGILQYPFFVKDGDLIENLGAVGAVVGHEMGHSIDDEGSKYDYTGKLNPWMPEEDTKKFLARGAKMIDEFNKIGHNGELTQGENIADLVGLTFAYHAAFPTGKGSVEDKKKFFVSYGRLWCNVMREKAQEMQLKTDPHSLGYARINEQVKNQDGFYEAYSCKKGDKLYIEPADRIKIW